MIDTDENPWLLRWCWFRMQECRPLKSISLLIHQDLQQRKIFHFYNSRLCYPRFLNTKWKDGQKKKKTKKMVTSINLKISSATSSWHTDQPTYLVRFGFKIPWISFTKWRYSVWGQHWAEEVNSYHGPPDSIFTLASGSLNTDRRFRNSFVLYLKRIIFCKANHYFTKFKFQHDAQSEKPVEPTFFSGLVHLLRLLHVLTLQPVVVDHLEIDIVVSDWPFISSHLKCLPKDGGISDDERAVGVGIPLLKELNGEVWDMHLLYLSNLCTPDHPNSTVNVFSVLARARERWGHRKYLHRCICRNPRVLCRSQHHNHGFLGFPRYTWTWVQKLDFSSLVSVCETCQVYSSDILVSSPTDLQSKELQMCILGREINLLLCIKYNFEVYNTYDI